MTTSLASYKAAAQLRAINKVDSRIKNDSLDHANILIEAMIGHATENDVIYIYSGSLPISTFDNLKITKAQTVKILVDNDSSLDWIRSLAVTQPSKFSVFKVSRPRDNHFLCTTGGFFRFETHAQNFEAEANFNELPVVTTLIEAFERYSSDALKVI